MKRWYIRRGEILQDIEVPLIGGPFWVREEDVEAAIQAAVQKEREEIRKEYTRLRKDHLQDAFALAMESRGEKKPEKIGRFLEADFSHDFPTIAAALRDVVRGLNQVIDAVNKLMDKAGK